MFVALMFGYCLVKMRAWSIVKQTIFSAAYAFLWYVFSSYDAFTIIEYTIYVLFVAFVVVVYFDMQQVI